MRRLIVLAPLALALVVTPVAELHGQALPEEGAAAFCWRGRPLPECSGFALFELEAAIAIASSSTVHESSAVTSEYPAFGHELNWNLGAMRNVSDRWALGGTLTLGTGSPTPLSGVRIRARKWLAPPWSAEIEVGAVDTGLNDRFGTGFSWGPTVGARLNMGDHASLFTRWKGVYAEAGSDGHFRRDAGFHQGLYVGASAGSTTAVAGSAVLGMLALWVAYSLSNTDF